MNILYHTFCKVHHTKGGTERTTITIASELKKCYGCLCYSIYEEDAETPREDCFENEFLWTSPLNIPNSIAFIRSLIIKNNINAVIIQGSFIHVSTFRKATEGLPCKILFAHHFEPGAETDMFTFKRICKAPHSTTREKIRWIKNVVLYPLMKRQYDRLLATNYRQAYENADQVILLSQTFVVPYQTFAGMSTSEISKFNIIPNALSYPYYPTINLKAKKRIVLIVSRLEETYKRIHRALEIWQSVKRNLDSVDWILKIVGDGPDKDKYEAFVRNHCINDVEFIGRAEPQPYYLEASIFIMTSISESWGLTLTESQQHGVVPFAFDSYPSLHDIITDGIDGVIIDNNDNQTYSTKLLDLMKNRNKRETMAKNGVKSSSRFEIEKIIKLWWKALND